MNYQKYLDATIEVMTANYLDGKTEIGAKTMEYKILLTSLTAYTNGIIDGEWIDLADNKALETIDEFKDARGEHEFFIADSMMSVPMDISEYDDPYKLVDLVKRLENLDETQLEAYDTIMNELGWEREEALDKVESWEFDAIEWNDGTIEECVGRYYAEQEGYMEKENYKIRIYFDYESYGRDICIDNYVCDNGKTIFVIFG